tara:strand:+ start:533 stop:766 length:234 start_codon:yes stop_codon:yes gene_type:complete
MTKQTIEFTGESLRSAEDLERLIKEAKFEVSYYEKDLKKAQDKIYLRQLSLDALINEQSALLETEYEYLNGDEKYNV